MADLVLPSLLYLAQHAPQSGFLALPGGSALREKFWTDPWTGSTRFVPSPASDSVSQRSQHIPFEYDPTQRKLTLCWPKTTGNAGTLCQIRNAIDKYMQLLGEINNIVKALRAFLFGQHQPIWVV